MEQIILFILVTFLVIMNVIAFILMGLDKHRARNHEWRIRESTLLMSALLGGSAGALFGMKFFHHKTRHLKFTIGLPVCLLINGMIVVLILWCIR